MRRLLVTASGIGGGGELLGLSGLRQQPPEFDGLASDRCAGTKATGADQRKEQSPKLLYLGPGVRGLSGLRFVTSGRTRA